MDKKTTTLYTYNVTPLPPRGFDEKTMEGTALLERHVSLFVSEAVSAAIQLNRTRCIKNVRSIEQRGPLTRPALLYDIE
uniref:SFRICE_019401 n=1 Tax=Spodoptera frugiperda TaxID=7108 RepID=A0A2H1WVB0_SPOFR